MVVTLQQIGTVVRDYIVQKLASSNTGLKRIGICLGAELISGYIENNGLTLKNDLTVGAKVFTSKNNINLEMLKNYLKNAMSQCGPFSIVLPFNLPTVTIEPSDVDELYNILMSMAVQEN
jgi:hypothetical protein